MSYYECKRCNTFKTKYKQNMIIHINRTRKCPKTAKAYLSTDEELYNSSLKMIDEAKSYIGKKINTRPANLVNVEEFLNKHAPDLSDYANYIIDNSKKGNQLRYALQEAAVAQKVRDAGHDAVIGHSKGKKGPFISEIFDVRESHYPDQHGNFELNPKFEEMYQNTPTRKELIQQQIDKIE